MTGHEIVQCVQAVAWCIGVPASIWAARPMIIKALEVSRDM